jgi:hypothetical protein
MRIIRVCPRWHLTYSNVIGNFDINAIEREWHIAMLSHKHRPLKGVKGEAGSLKQRVVWKEHAEG